MSSNEFEKLSVVRGWGSSLCREVGIREKSILGMHSAIQHNRCCESSFNAFCTALCETNSLSSVITIVAQLPCSSCSTEAYLQ